MAACGNVEHKAPAIVSEISIKCAPTEPFGAKEGRAEDAPASHEIKKSGAA
jgi:hypothetical protein